MAIHVTVPIYQQKDGGQMTWTTVGLGPHTLSHSGGSKVKVQRKLVDKLRKVIESVDPSELELFQLARGTKLTFARLELNLRGKPGRRRVVGVFPLIAEPRWVSDDVRIWVVYHPLRQDEWFAAETEADIENKATSFCRAVWADLDQWDIEALRADSKDSLTSISLSASPKTLLDKLPSKREDNALAGFGRPGDGAVLSKIGVNQTSRVIEGTLPLGMPRSPYRQHLQLLLGGRRKRPTIVVGPPGVGKSTIIHRWIADQLIEDQFEVHRNLDKIHNVWTVSGKRIIAGMSMLGDWEQRCVDVVVEAKRRRAVLVVEDLHLFGRLGQSRQSDRNLAGFFRGPVARGELVLIGELTPAQLQRLDDDAPSFAALFSRVHVQPTERAETLQMMMHLARTLELAGGCHFHPFTYRAIIELGGSLFPWTAFPGKALDMLRQLVERNPVMRSTREIGPDAVIQLLSRQTGLPENLLTLDARLDPEQVRERFARRVMGQPSAVDAARDLICRVRAGLTDPRRPLAVMLFTGPTGTGKTELARSIAEYLFGDISRLVRLDMSEYASPDAVTRMIGDRFAPEGQLTQRIREQPFSVVLFDEIEKAHPLVLNLLLQLFDEGRLTDAAGNTASFNHAVIVMTSNLGARPQRPIGFGESSERVLGEIERAVREFFPPELFNRIDRVVPFRPLTPRVAEDIATKELARLLGRRGLKERNIFVYANQAVKQRIVREAFDPAHGARTVKRYLEDRIGSLLADEITSGGKASMRVMRIYESNDTFQLHVEPLTEMEPALADWALLPLVELPALKLTEHLQAAAAPLDALLEAEKLDEIDDRVRASDDPQELYYFADAYKDRLREVRAWISARTGQRSDGAQVHAPSAIKKAGKDALLDRIAEAGFLAKNFDRVTDPDEHVAWVEILRVGHGQRSGEIRQRGRGLMAWMIEWLIEAGGDDWLEAICLRYPKGSIKHWQGDGCGAEATNTLTDRERQPIHAILKLVGLFAVEAFRGEQGCHIWRSLADEPEIVRVRMWTGDPDGAVRPVMLDHLARLRAFEGALEQGITPLPDNPEKLMPAVRTLDFRPPLRDGEVFPVEIEDFYLGYTGALNVLSIRDAMRLVWLIRKSRAPEEDA